MSGSRFLAGSPGFPAELALAADGSGDEECREWLERWWEWELRWRAAASAALRLAPPPWLGACWEARTSEALDHTPPCLEWHWFYGRLSSLPRKPAQRLGFVRLGKKEKDTPCLQLCLGAGALPCKGRTPSYDVVYRLCRKASDGACLGQPHQTYFFSTCLLERK